MRIEARPEGEEAALTSEEGEMWAATNFFIELEDSDTFGMDFFENDVNGGVRLLIEDCEIDLDPRWSGGSALSLSWESLAVAKSGPWH